MKKETLHVHFVCSGNVFRSRLAEALLRSLEVPHLLVSSSGVTAQKNTDGPLTWFAARLFKRHNLVQHMSSFWVQTTPEILSDVDRVIVMNKESVNELNRLSKAPVAHEVWNVLDMKDFGFTSDDLSDEELVRAIHVSEEIFETIKKNVVALANTIISR